MINPTIIKKMEALAAEAKDYTTHDVFKTGQCSCVLQFPDPAMQCAAGTAGTLCLSALILFN